MPTGFMTRHFIWLLALAFSSPALADVALIGVIGNKAAVLAIDGGDPKTVKVGQTWKNIKVLKIEGLSALVDIEGEQLVLQLSAHYRTGGDMLVRRDRVELAADPQGHFYVDGAVNQLPVRFVVDTGATLVSLPQQDAERLGLNYRGGKRGVSRTANGPVTVFLVKLDTLKIGNIEVHNVDALVHEGAGLDQALLGMSFLNRVNMQREGATMTLIQRF